MNSEDDSDDNWEPEPSAPMDKQPGRSAACNDGVSRHSSAVNDDSDKDTEDELGSMDSDADSELDEEYFPASTACGRDAAAEPASPLDMNEFQTELLQSEDSANDHALREIVPEDCQTFSWSDDHKMFLGERETFTGTSGPTFNVTDTTRPIDVFHKMFDDGFVDGLVTETNRHAVQRFAMLHKQNKLGQQLASDIWTNTDRSEMISFLAIIILQGLYPLEDEKSYFNFYGILAMPYFARIMPFNRYLLLKSFINFADTSSVRPISRLSKIQPIIEYFNCKFSSLYMPSQEIIIDESLLERCGRKSFAQKIMPKTLKTYELCESSSGYLWKFFVCDKKENATTNTQTINCNRRVGDGAQMQEDNEDRFTKPTTRIINELMEPLLHRGHTLIMDNFYNCPLLLRNLKRQKTDCYGTLRLNREFVPDSLGDLTQENLRYGEVVVKYSNDLVIMVWRKVKLVGMISTYHKLKSSDINSVPSIVLDYNKSRGGFDREDQLLSSQPVECVRKNNAWYKKLFRQMYNAAVSNCYVIFSSYHRSISHRQFRTELAEELLSRYRQIDLPHKHRVLNARSTSAGPVATTALQRKPGLPVEDNHFPIRTGSKSSVCFLCPEITKYKCEECDVNLCIGCFKPYHKPSPKKS